MSIEQDRSDQRRAERREANARSTVRRDGIEPFDATVLDVSQTGLRMDCPLDLAIGAEVSVGLAGVGARAATVSWRKGRTYGCAFAEPLDEQEVRDAFTRQTVVQVVFPAAEPEEEALPEAAAPAAAAAAGDDRWMAREWTIRVVALGAMAMAMIWHVM